MPGPGKEKVLNSLRNLKPLLARRYGVVERGLFGSVVRGESAEEGDMDILVEKGKLGEVIYA